MSAEGKKKNGMAGVRKAANSPFRLNGLPPDWQARRRGVFHSGAAPSSGSKTLLGLLGGVWAEKLGFSMHGTTAFYENMMVHAESRSTILKS